MADGNRTGALKGCIAAYIAEVRPKLDDLYRWPIPPLTLDIPFEQGADSLTRANMRLKRTLHAAWQDAHEARRYDTAHWYVARWGGVKRNKRETLEGYVTASESDLLSRGIDGIATWSKVLVVRGPDRYAIFDARVATSMNALQLIQGIGNPIFFPNLLNQNRTIKQFQKWIRARVLERSRYIPKAEVYPTYLDIMTDVAKGAGLSSLDEIEMTLFANAETLAREAMAAC